MSAETTKAITRRKNTWLFNKVFSGDGIDVGCGADILKKEDFPNITSVEPFDLQHGDANFIDKYVTKKYDFVHSSNCLEHMREPQDALRRWMQILKSGGYLIATWPDEDLYEQGVFPSMWNHDHKATFSIFKNKSWSPRHYNVIDMLIVLNDISEIIKVELVDTFYNYDLKNIDQTRGNAEAFIEIILKRK